MGGILRGKIWNSEMWPLLALKVWAAVFFLAVATDQPKFHCITQLHPQLSALLTVHTNVIVVTIRISIGDLISGWGRQQRRLPRAANTFAPPLHCCCTVCVYTHFTVFVILMGAVKVFPNSDREVSVAKPEILRRRWSRVYDGAS